MKDCTTRVHARATLWRLYPPPPVPMMRPSQCLSASRHKAAARVRVGVFRPAQVGNRITLQAVGAALHENELRLLRIDIGLHPLPCPPELGVIRARRQGNIQFCSLRPALAGLVRMTGSRVQVPSILVDIGKYQVGIILESVEDAVAVMSVDIDVGDSLQSVLQAQVLSCDAAIVENAESGGAIASRMMQSGNGNKCAPVVAVHDFVNSAQAPRRRQPTPRHRFL